MELVTRIMIYSINLYLSPLSGGSTTFDDLTVLPDEFNERFSHKGPGVVSMANKGDLSLSNDLFFILIYLSDIRI